MAITINDFGTALYNALTFGMDALKIFMVFLVSGGLMSIFISSLKR